MMALVRSTTTSSHVKWVIIIVVICFLEDEKTMRVHCAVADPKRNYMDISNFPTSYLNPCQKDRCNVVCVVYDNFQ